MWPLRSPKEMRVWLLGQMKVSFSLIRAVSVPWKSVLGLRPRFSHRMRFKSDTVVNWLRFSLNI